MSDPRMVYGPWCPTNYLRWNGTVLEQKMRRRAKHYPPQGPASSRYEFEWHAVPLVSGP